jgi:predicted nucleic acid-binding protein
VIVVDASAAVSGLLRAGPARSRLATDALHAPHLLDTEVTDAIRKLVVRQRLTTQEADGALAGWKQLGFHRYPTIGLIDRIWELRHNVSAYDAAYVALAEALGCHLVSADRRLAAAEGPRCTIEIVPP